MERIQKYKIEDESLDDQADNYIYSQNSLPKNKTSNINNNNIINIPSEIKEDVINPTNSNNNNFEEEINLTNENESMNNNNEINDNEKEKGYHHVQIIDEDVENFKRRLDIMVKNFRTDTLKDFMAIKRNLLIEQKTCRGI